MFTGSIVAIVTPMLGQTSSIAPELDLDALERLCEWHIGQGTDGIVVMGTTGESASVSDAQYVQAIEVAVKTIAGRIPVIAGTGAISTEKTISMTQRAFKLGADGALVATPYYCKPSQEGLYQHYKAVAESCDLPIILYNVPSRTACDLLPKTVARLAELNNIVAIKEATGDITRIKQIAGTSRSKLLYLSGDDESALKFLESGGDGVVSVTANVVPSLMSKMCGLAKSRNFKQAQLIDQKISRLHNDLFLEANPIPVKWALARMGMIEQSIRLPLTVLSKKHHQTILKALEIANVKTQ